MSSLFKKITQLPIDIRSYDGQIELEIGCNDGETLCTLAKRSPRTLFVGVEIKEDACLKAYKSANGERLVNVMIVNQEGYEHLSTCWPNNSLRVIHIYFPTPDPKTIGLNNRLVSASFVSEAYRVLRQYGELRLVTDDYDYFKRAKMTFPIHQWIAVPWEPLPLGNKSGYFVGSREERHYKNFKQVEIFAIQLLRL